MNNIPREAKDIPINKDTNIYLLREQRKPSLVDEAAKNRIEEKQGVIMDLLPRLCPL